MLNLGFSKQIYLQTILIPITFCDVLLRQLMIVEYSYIIYNHEKIFIVYFFCVGSNTIRSNISILFIPDPGIENVATQQRCLPIKILYLRKDFVYSG